MDAHCVPHAPYGFISEAFSQDRLVQFQHFYLQVIYAKED